MISRNRLFFFVLLNISFNAYIECGFFDTITGDVINLKDKLVNEGEKAIKSVEKTVLNPVKDEFFSFMKDTVFSGLKGTCFKGSDDANTALLGLIENLYDVFDVSALPKLLSKIPSGPKDVIKSILEQVCRKREIITKFRDNINRIIKPCLGPHVLTIYQLIMEDKMRIDIKLFNFICENNDALIHLLLSPNSFGCFEERKDDFQQCMKTKFQKYDSEFSPKFMNGTTMCNVMDSMQCCIVSSLKKCSDQTLHNFVEPMLESVRKPCDTITSVREPCNNGTKFGSNSLVTVITIVLLNIVLKKYIL